MTAEDVLGRAAELVEQAWGQSPSIFAMRTGPWCAAMAINHAAMLLSHGMRKFDEADRASGEAFAALARQIGPDETTDIVAWNDTVGRTQAEVATELRNAKRFL